MSMGVMYWTDHPFGAEEVAIWPPNGSKMSQARPAVGPLFPEYGNQPYAPTGTVGLAKVFGFPNATPQTAISKIRTRRRRRTERINVLVENGRQGFRAKTQAPSKRVSRYPNDATKSIFVKRFRDQHLYWNLKRVLNYEQTDHISHRGRPFSAQNRLTVLLVKRTREGLRRHAQKFSKAFAFQASFIFRKQYTPKRASSPCGLLALSTVNRSEPTSVA
jgi:hypothetical protein